MRTHGALLKRGRESLADLLSDHLSVAGRRRWEWGACDCFLFVADWVEKVTGIDPAGEFRGAYSDARQARRIIKQCGGPVAFCHGLLSCAGCTVGEPGVGSVALVKVGFNHWRDRLVLVPAGAIHVRHKLWAVKTSDGLVMADFQPVMTWTLPHA